MFSDDNISNQIRKNEEAIQKTYELYANTTLPSIKEKTEIVNPSSNFDDAFSKFKNSIQKARETLTKEPVSQNDINPALQTSLKKLQSVNQRLQIEKVNNMSIAQKNSALSIDSENSKLKTQEQKSVLAQKLDNLKLNREISNINSSVANSWINNISKA